MSLRTALVLTKVDRAEEHLKELELSVGAHMAEHFSIIPARLSVQAGGGYFEISAPLPSHRYGRHAALIGDVVHNLRSALDHLAWQLVLANGGTPRDQLGAPLTTFPIKLEPKNVRIPGGVAPDAMKAVEALQPYNVQPDSPADADLWHLHRLDIVDKHHGLLLSPVHFDRPAMSGRLGLYDGTLMLDRRTPDGVELKFVADRFSDYTNVKAGMSFFLCLDADLPGARRPVVTRMRELLGLVRDGICPQLIPYL